METIWIVVPCYNEGKRFNRVEFEHLLEDTTVQLLLIDDGSTDDTLQVLEQFGQDYSSQTLLIKQKRNIGKAESIRAGMLTALDNDASMIGYLDADLATPVNEFQRLIDLMRSKKDCPVLMGCRVRRLGATIHRQPCRHYLGRIFATFSSTILKVGVYDTQCGAKIFRKTDALEYALSFPFQSRWAFDVELLGRLLYPEKRVDALNPSDFIEEPLKTWRDIGGSKMKLATMIKTGIELLVIYLSLKTRRR